jgi:hypothetical protein
VRAVLEPQELHAVLHELNKAKACEFLDVSSECASDV